MSHCSNPFASGHHVEKRRDGPQESCQHSESSASATSQSICNPPSLPTIPSPSSSSSSSICPIPDPAVYFQEVLSLASSFSPHNCPASPSHTFATAPTSSGSTIVSIPHASTSSVVSAQPHGSEFLPTVLLQIPAPSSSPYSGASFAVEVCIAPHLGWRWLSRIYHPMFTEGHLLCKCMILDRHGAYRSPTEVVHQILLFLEKPHYTIRCPICHLNEMAFAESQTDLSFFLKKARVHTPGAFPLSDDDLRSTICPSSLPSPTSLASMDFGFLLISGAFSDVKLVSIRVPEHMHEYLCTYIPSKSTWN